MRMSKMFCEPEELETATREEQITEATRCLHLLAEKYNLHPMVLKRWQTGLLCYSFTTFWGLRAFVNDMPFDSLPKDAPAAKMLRITKHSEFSEMIHNFENERDCVVYHAMLTGPFLTLFFISPHKFDWSMFDEYDLPEDAFLTYTYNLDIPQYSEFGSVRVCSVNRALIRIE